MWFTLLVVFVAFLAGWLVGPRVVAWISATLGAPGA